MSLQPNGRSDFDLLPERQEFRSELVLIREHTDVAEARRLAGFLCEYAGFDETKNGQVAIVVTELGGNVIKHAGNGEIVLRLLFDSQARVIGIRLTCFDFGPGIENLTKAMQDGFSTAGSPGTGLGAIQRLSSRFRVFTQQDRGTVQVVDFVRGVTASPEHEVGAVCIPLGREQVCGDGWSSYEADGRLIVMVSDGLGHGPGAAEATEEARRVFWREKGRDPDQILSVMNGALQKTRGAAIAIAEIQPASGVLRFAGIGNISASTHTPAASGVVGRALLSTNGTVGMGTRQARLYSSPWTPDSILILHSDGLSARWHLADYPGLVYASPAIIAGVLYRDFRRGTDDATIVTVGRSGR